jgi:hypothetical protein
MNNVAKFHSHSLYSSGEINNNVLKFWFLQDLQAIHCGSAATSKTVTKYCSRNCSEFHSRYIRGIMLLCKKHTTIADQEFKVFPPRRPGFKPGWARGIL